MKTSYKLLLGAIILLAAALGLSKLKALPLNPLRERSPYSVRHYAWVQDYDNPRSLAVIDTRTDQVVRRYRMPWKKDLIPSSVDDHGNVYLYQVGLGLLQNKPYIFYPSKGVFVKHFETHGLLQTHVFRIGDRIFVSNNSNGEHFPAPPRGGSLEIYDARSFNMIKRFFYTDFGFPTDCSCWLDLQQQVFYVSVITLNSKGYSNEDTRTYFLTFDLKAMTQLKQFPTDYWASDSLNIAGDQDNLYVLRSIPKYYGTRAEYEKHVLPSFCTFSKASIGPVSGPKHQAGFDSPLCYGAGIVALEKYHRVILSTVSRGIEFYASPQLTLLQAYPEIKSVLSIKYVGNNKLYISVNDYDKNRVGIEVIDARTMKRRGFIPGRFGHFADNPYVE